MKREPKRLHAMKVQRIGSLNIGTTIGGWSVWNAHVASGLYFYRFEAASLSDKNEQFVDVKKMLLLK